MDDTITLDDPHTGPTRIWHSLDDGRVQCDVCPSACRLHEGQRGLCFAPARVDDRVVLTCYGRSRGSGWTRWRRSRSTTSCPAAQCCPLAPTCDAFALRGLLHWARRHEPDVRLLHLGTSAHTIRAPGRVVGYGAFELVSPVRAVRAND